MTVTLIQIHEQDERTPRFRAVAGTRQTLGQTAGEALDSLLAQEDGNIESSLILIQRFVPDSYFTQAQYDRMQELRARHSNLTTLEDKELDTLIEAELEATISRTTLLHP